jgi:hypothetical protein
MLEKALLFTGEDNEDEALLSTGKDNKQDGQQSPLTAYFENLDWETTGTEM